MSDDKDKIPPGSVFYIRMLNHYADDSLALNGESNVGGLKIKDALDPLISDVQEYGEFGYVYECRPIIKVIRPNLKIIDFRKKQKELKP